jgi:adenylosuccinate synthase
MSVDVIVGMQRGDEGKGRFSDMLAAEHDIIVRFNGGHNAGHTVVLPDGRDLALHLIPSGIAHDHVLNIIGNGTLVNPQKLIEEIEDVESKGIEVNPQNLMLSSAAHLILPHHKCEDELRETGSSRQGSTQVGIAQAAAAKAMRNGVRAEMINNDSDKLRGIVYDGLRAQRKLRKAAGLSPINEKEEALEYVECAKRLGGYVTDTVLFLNKELRKDKPARVLAEGAQAFLLDIDHGMYPFVTSSSTTSGGVANGLGIPPKFIDRVTGIIKAVPSHVGDGPFVTETHNIEQLERLHGDKGTIDAEVGTTTGRTRRLGFLDIPQLRRAQMVNGTDEIALTKLDWVPRYGAEIQICVSYVLNGRNYSVAPDSADELAKAYPIYERVPSWDEDDDIRNVRKSKDLPKNAQGYIEYVENKLEAPITMIGVGPNRDEVIVRR